MSYIGTTKIGKMYLGSTEIAKVYLGNDLVFQNTIPVVQYIRGGADGSYIDTGISADSTTRVVVWARNWNPSGLCLFGSRVDATTNAFAAFASVNQQTGFIRFDYGAAQFLSQDAFRYLSGYHKYEANGNEFLVDDSVIITATAATFSNNVNIHLFGVNTNGTHTDMALPADICACQIYKSGVLVRDFSAVNTPSVGLYDSVSNTLFTNAGTGSLSYDVFYRENYTPLEYVSCTGSQYFDSGVLGTYGGAAVVKFMPTNTTAVYNAVFGYRDSSACCDLSLGNTSQANRYSYWRLGTDKSSVTVSSTTLTNKALVASKSNNTMNLYENGSQLGSATKRGVSTSFQTPYSMAVGDRRNGEDSVHPSEYFIGRFYYVGFGKDRSFVPAKKGTKIGMYDTYNDVFYESATATPFVAGPTI